MYDAIVVGARCAGSPTAMLLARKGYKVLLVDRTTFPSDTMSTHRDVELLVEAIDAGFSGRLVLEEALAEYERRRNEVAISGLEDACEDASLEPPLPPEGGEEAALFAALQINQEETNRFVGTIVGTVSEQEFFSPENVQRIISAA